MFKRHLLFWVCGTMLLASCLKAYVPITNPPITLSDVAGTYKTGSLKWEMGIVDSVNYKGVDDSASFTVSNYVNDSIFVSILSKVGLNNKRFKLPFVSKTDSILSTRLIFGKTISSPGFFLYKEDYYLSIKFDYSAPTKITSATMLNSSIKGMNDTTIYTEKVDFATIKQ